MLELREAALAILADTDVQSKVSQLASLFDDYQTKKIALNISSSLDSRDIRLPGRPANPDLVAPKFVPKRKMDTVEGRAILWHSLAHIEFNAMNLALDAIWRFPNMPQAYYEDWLRVAKEESYHFSLINAHLKTFGFSYGDFPAHNSLWEMVERTTDSVIARMALVPRTMEARGLDAVPEIRDRFKQIKDERAVEILEIILHDEIGHVLVGNRWFNFLCANKGLSPIATYRELAEKYRAPTLRGPFNFDAREQAGFTSEELEILESLSEKRTQAA
ncbi:ferritin-like domain-containing protein [Polynucleobacter sp. AP-Ainpum-60-G11]|uniref:ferritin-like domain-containing protein n=1 Tax=Polynucleobacter sp. AP-Ainpum-60-G11 TaxID=2576926 RepID=UPI001BFD3E10|nr:ferritin-like domain-containing protein [Polynucleobacter sp. AP-Ainpum-60-G11]QWE26115.1 ferritin-like domain-containing protein [Polynucleobacter sp. AP-Ainpum-60-G11]